MCRTVSRNVDFHSFLEGNLAMSIKIFERTYIYCRKLFYRYTDMDMQRYRRKDAHCSIVHNSEK